MRAIAIAAAVGSLTGCAYSPLDNLEPDGDFERGTDCAGWDLIDGNGTAQRVSPGHTGSGACQVCSSTELKPYGLDDHTDAVRGAAPGSHYVARAFIRAGSMAGDPFDNVTIYIRESATNGPILDATTSGNLVAVTPGGGWVETRAEHTMGNSAVAMDVSVSGTSAASCFVVDDIVLFRTD